MAVTPIPLAPALKEEFPEVEYSTRFSGTGVRYRKGEQYIYQLGCYADPDFFRMFSFPLLQGDADTILEDPHSIVLTRSMAQSYFGSENPLGRIMTTVDGSDYLVTGVMEDPPSNSHLRFDFVIPFVGLGESERDLNAWGDVSWWTYVMLRKGSGVRDIERKITDLVDRNMEDNTGVYRLQGLTGIHLHSRH